VSEEYESLSVTILAAPQRKR